jgi:hypothetical protein
MEAVMLQGFKTVIFNIVALVAAWLATNYGITIAPEEQAAIAVTIVTIGNIILRIFTKSAIFKKHDQ